MRDTACTISKKEQLKQYSHILLAAKQIGEHRNNPKSTVFSNVLRPGDNANLVQWLSSDLETNESVMRSVISAVISSPDDSCAIRSSELFGEIRSICSRKAETMNDGFGLLLEAIQSFQSLIPSEELRLLARRVSDMREDENDFSGWADVLVGDIKDAKD